MSKIFEYGEKSFQPLNKSHANFHGENIILTNYPIKYNFLIIDPDIKVKNIDCFFLYQDFYILIYMIRLHKINIIYFYVSIKSLNLFFVLTTNGIRSN